jgi:hypothetical protein
MIDSLNIDEELNFYDAFYRDLTDAEWIQMREDSSADAYMEAMIAEQEAVCADRTWVWPEPTEEVKNYITDDLPF